MLSKEDNELITHVGPGTPMGTLMRQYWLPAMLSSELSEPDCTPVRLMLLNEKLIAFRDSNGKVGILADACPHRGASLFFGRNEECGLRCVYHGWKFDVDGACVDMPNEPAESNFKHKVKAVSYPCQERGGLVWTYMGPRETPPPLPEIESNMLGEESTAIAMQRECNWVQTMEGDIDTVHTGMLHYGSLRPEDQPKGTFAEYVLKDRAPRYEVIDTPGGATYGAYRPGRPGEQYWRIAQFMFPIFTIAPQGLLGRGKFCTAWVPMDDHHTLTIFMMPKSRQLLRQQQSVNVPADNTTNPPPALSTLNALVKPNTTEWLGRFRTHQTLANDFKIDREVQRKNEGIEGYTGISGVPIQDQAIQESMGPIYNRTNEHLGTSDAMVIRVRRRLLAAAKALEEDGTTPPGVDDPTVYHVRAGGTYLPEGVDWVEATKDLRRAFVEHPELDPAITGQGIAG